MARDRDRELAILSRHVYGGPDAPPLPPGWEQLAIPPELARNAKTGYEGAAYRETLTGEIVVAHAGVDEPRDLGPALAIATGLVPREQFLRGRALMAFVRNTYGSEGPITQTGHSLGGAVAQLLAAYARRAGVTIETVTFGSPGVLGMLSQLGITEPADYSFVTNHVHPRDPIGNHGTHVGRTEYTTHDSGIVESLAPICTVVLPCYVAGAVVYVGRYHPIARYVEALGGPIGLDNDLFDPPDLAPPATFTLSSTDSDGALQEILGGRWLPSVSVEAPELDDLGLVVSPGQSGQPPTLGVLAGDGGSPPGTVLPGDGEGHVTPPAAGHGQDIAVEAGGDAGVVSSHTREASGHSFRAGDEANRLTDAADRLPPSVATDAAEEVRLVADGQSLVVTGGSPATRLEVAPDGSGVARVAGEGDIPDTESLPGGVSRGDPALVEHPSGIEDASTPDAGASSSAEAVVPVLGPDPGDPGSTLSPPPTATPDYGISQAYGLDASTADPGLDAPSLPAADPGASAPPEPAPHAEIPPSFEDFWLPEPPVSVPQPPPVYEPPPVFYEAPPIFYEPPPIFYEAPPIFYEPPPIFYEPPPIFYEPPPVFYEPPPVFYEPPPVFYEPPPVFYEPPPVFYEPPPVFHMPSPVYSFNFSYLFIDPVVVDLDANGLDLVGLWDSSIYFDLDADGFVERTGWVKPTDGFLVVDLNGNGRIDDSTEFFSEKFGQGASSGLAALTTLDDNSDRRLDADDPAFPSVQVWRDVTQDGRTGAGELSTLTALGITAIALDGAPTRRLNEGHRILNETSASRIDGSTVPVADVGMLMERHGFRHELLTGGEGALIESQVEQLRSAMAGFAPPPPGQPALTPEVRDALEPTLAAAWPRHPPGPP